MKKIYSGFKQSVNNFSILVYLLSIIISSLVFNNPIIVLVVFLSLLFVAKFTQREDSKGYFKFTVIIFLTTIIFNLIINQRGSNVLFQIPLLRVTTESLLNAGILAFSFVNLLLAFYIYDSLTNVKVIFDLLSKSLRSIAIVFILTIKFIPKIIQIFENTSFLYKFRNNNYHGNGKVSKQMDLLEIVLNKSVASFMNVSDVLITKGYNERAKVSRDYHGTKSDYIFFTVSFLTIIFNFTMIFLKTGKVDFGSATVKFGINSNIIIISVINLIMITMPILIGVFQYLWWKWYISKTTASNMPTVKNFR
ncbi:energy-coupling factor transporter transmembrane component T [Companilactobacillus nodensis]|uniref:Metal ion ABC transporter permease n=1 Tax=Companilactobacillus nodensis DSM 19682 = JCM 14932 = NBRC 107160 TaxID=1423775 RepID=A0A0R1KD84_9LACO|nr:energy-coupling factor transporter transmembrane component T [Companilactobacillus nodensis]KRK78676.1 metal ion ABC transporter permease [Companilactobacillus nodensis DSM 19682 = JCM 14932 = NBRC 107160]